MLKTAVYCAQPVSLRYPRGNGSGDTLDSEMKELPIGKGELLKEGRDILILAIGVSVRPALKAAMRLQERGIRATVVNARFVKPLDGHMICSLASWTKRVLTVEENALQGGFGSAVLELFEEKKMSNLRVRRLGVPDTFVEHGTQEELRRKFGLDADGIFHAAASLFAK
jgi:1-deoxy-D-xylulose-5-phosphate synthase